MEFAFTQEQRMIMDMAQDFLTEISPSDKIREAMTTDRGYITELWQRVCEEMCWQAITIPEQYGGLGLGYVEQAIVMEQMGKQLFCSPFLATQALATNALLLCANEQQKQRWLTELAQGKITASLGWLSGSSLQNRHWGSQSVQASFTLCEGGAILNGEWQQVIDGHSCDLLIVTARSPANGHIKLFAVEPKACQIQRLPLPTLDQTRKLSRISATQLFVPESDILGTQADQHKELELILSLATIALAAEQAGGSASTLTSSVDYLKERVQFNRPLASFQALKHRAADMKLELESAISAVYYAACIADAWSQGAKSDSALHRAASMAKSVCSDTFTFCAQEALQLHGGVGFTWEYDVHLYLKRAQSSATLFGAANIHRARVADSLLGPVERQETGYETDLQP
ncbi:acyl-CoA/acyl-ACP dehydrogenase [Shewanella submarina]|uniref:Acyl-CoA dehydrogenase family protein n=1 Tax=Shewanella submarina TaxID=2016376 RepID=A0ABV7GCX7_9GAMM|nr:acyl-CoA dehydrogenase family protein [Shewanella submarina]MCL1039135.1 acyl-CoA/acyl-ACP dehydrogenase [Shewanella submarina]